MKERKLMQTAWYKWLRKAKAKRMGVQEKICKHMIENKIAKVLKVLKH